MAQPTLLGAQQIADATAAYFGQPILKMTAPGGKSRASYRVYFPNRSVIVSQRSQPGQMAVETRVLKALEPVTDRVPRLLGVTDGLLFQSDAGTDRLNRVIHTLAPEARPALAGKAVDALFEVHRAALRAGLDRDLPTASITPYPDDDLFQTVRRAAEQLRCDPLGFDSSRLSPWFRTPPRRFVKWDCRAGNAALDEAGYLRWFDFEDARQAQGPEDFAWLIADETWPVAADTMLDLVRARLTPEDTADPDAYMAYLEQFTTLHALRRIRLIFSEAKRRGWLDRITILKYDTVGVNPHMGERLSLMAAALAQRHSATAPLVALFDRAAETFRMVRSPA